jgi:hypothetical protein
MEAHLKANRRDAAWVFSRRTTLQVEVHGVLFSCCGLSVEGKYSRTNILWRTVDLTPHRRLACLGALLTVLAIGMDPSVQQTIVVRTRMVDSMQETRIPRSQYFVQYSDYETGTVSQPVLGLVGALYNGLYSAGSGHNISDVTPSCPTGNCQYPLFQSLAFCGSCENATSTMKTTCSEAFAEDYEQDFIYCQFKLPNGVQVNASHSSHQYDDADFNPEANLTIVGTGVDYDVVDPMGPNGSVLDYTVMKALIESNRTGISRASPLDAGISVTADRCKLRFCVNTYESSVTDGQLTEKTLSTWDLGSAKIQWNGNLTLRPPSANNNTDETFLIGENAADTLISWLYNKTRTSNSVGVNRYFGRESDGRFYSEEMTLLLAKADTTDIFRDLAKTLTIYLRTLGDNQKLPHEYIGESLPDNGPVKGTAYELQAYVAIRWVWLAYPAALLALTQIFFILVVAQSAMNGTAVWKSSPLALLFHGLSGLSVQQEQRCDAMDLREMDETAKGIKVRLQEARLVVVEK